MTELVGMVALFVLVGFGFIFVHLLVGKLIRPAKPEAEKLTIYECGEPTIGSAWVQFDVRFYVVALLFVIFDVEVAFFFPWAVVFGQANTIAHHAAVPERPAEVAAYRNEVGQLDAVRAQARPNEAIVRDNQTAARRFARLAFYDLLVFFGVLLVGFAYLWRRGDLAWVRSTAAEQQS
ncbi:MAG: NADH-quinone oxidoreductase subunit A [Gemmataceae bacterium]|nr:NADH-quinone oxidoreductase subunit A [Gemmataceae bacterium]